MAARRRTRTALETTQHSDHAVRQRKALELRKQGFGFDHIAQELGYTNRSGAYKAVQAALADITAEAADDVRRLELERLDGLWERAGAALRDSDNARDTAAAVGAAIKVQERRARLLGLDAPVKTQEVAPDKLTDEQLLAEIDRVRSALVAKLGAA